VRVCRVTLCACVCVCACVCFDADEMCDHTHSHLNHPYNMGSLPLCGNMVWPLLFFGTRVGSLWRASKREHWPKPSPLASRANALHQRYTTCTDAQVWNPNFCTQLRQKDRALRVPGPTPLRLCVCVCMCEWVCQHA
jgi:hypothetical protein